MKQIEHVVKQKTIVYCDYCKKKLHTNSDGYTPDLHTWFFYSGDELPIAYSELNDDLDLCEQCFTLFKEEKEKYLIPYIELLNKLS